MTYQELVEGLNSGRRTLHYEPCTKTIGPRGGIRFHITRYRINGSLKTWKRTPGKFRLPLKYGFYGYDALTEYDLLRVHWEQDCPLSKEERSVS